MKLIYSRAVCKISSIEPFVTPVYSGNFRCLVWKIAIRRTLLKKCMIFIQIFDIVCSNSNLILSWVGFCVTPLVLLQLLNEKGSYSHASKRGMLRKMSLKTWMTIEEEVLKYFSSFNRKKFLKTVKVFMKLLENKPLS